MGKWTDEELEIIRQGASDGKTAKQIVKDLNGTRSRSAVVAKLSRCGVQLARARNPKVIVASLAAGHIAKAVNPYVPQVTLGEAEELDEEIEISTHLIRLEHKENVTFEQLTKRHCKWPIHEDGQDALFCGKTRVAGRPYCEEHLKRSLDPRKPKKINITPEASGSRTVSSHQRNSSKDTELFSYLSEQERSRISEKKSPSSSSSTE
jgi:hypothetical protein